MLLVGGSYTSSAGIPWQGTFQTLESETSDCTPPPTSALGQYSSFGTFIITSDISVSF